MGCRQESVLQAGAEDQEKERAHEGSGKRHALHPTSSKSLPAESWLGGGLRRGLRRAKKPGASGMMKAPHPLHGWRVRSPERGRDLHEFQDRDPRGYLEPCPPGPLRWVRRTT